MSDNYYLPLDLDLIKNSNNSNINIYQTGSSYNNQKKYVDLKINGRLFPTWILRNFKKYHLPEIMQTGDDPCNQVQTNEKAALKAYQSFTSHFLDYNSPYRDILLYHGVGAGKTRNVINIYNMLYNYNPGWNVFILLKATMKNSVWLPELQKWIQEDEKEFRLENIVFISYDAPNADKSFMKAVQEADASKKNLFIIEECHQFISNVYSNVTTQQGRRAYLIYEHIIQDKKESDGTRVICLSATPAINKPYEIALLFNLLRPGSFPKKESKFNQIYISNSSYPRLSDDKKNNFQRRIMGLVSYYIGATPDYFPSKTVNYVDIIMSDYQNDIYSFYEEKERIMAQKARQTGGTDNTYKVLSRQACNFVFPLMGQNLTGESRPRPGQFKVSKNDANNLEKGYESSLDKKKDSEKYLAMQNYIHALQKFKNALKNYFDEKKNLDEKEGYTILDDFKKLEKIPFNEYTQSNSKKSNLFLAMYECSAKMLAMIVNILQSPGLVLVYSNYVLVEGLEYFKLYLDYFGFEYYKDMYKGTDYKRYMDYNGLIDKNVRKQNIDIFRNSDNVTGKLCKIICVSSAGAEGLDLKNIRQVHIMEPHWHETRILQIIGRAVRLCSHKELPLNERHVEIYRYKSIRKDSNKLTNKITTDQVVENVARTKEGLLQSFLDAVKEAAIDCKLFQNHNKLERDFKCFQFDEPSLFDNQIGPAYKEDFDDDLLLDNGSNNPNSKLVRIKVLKIIAVIQLTPDDAEEMKYSKPENYWYNPDTKVIYDYDLHFAVGKIGVDNDGINKQLDTKTYIIDKMIPIPILN
jgi:superfamily II DNA or RNA helicase